MQMIEMSMTAARKAADTMLSTDRCGPRLCQQQHIRIIVVSTEIETELNNNL